MQLRLGTLTPRLHRHGVEELEQDNTSTKSLLRQAVLALIVPTRALMGPLEMANGDFLSPRSIRSPQGIGSNGAL